jgi:alkaline phosphatase D
MKSLWIVILGVIIYSASVFSLNNNTLMLNKIERLNKLAFGSCNNQLFPQKQWKNMLPLKPDLFMFGGDNIYGDKKYTFPGVEWDYWVQNSRPSYHKFKKHVPIIGIWDDHDYGKNNGGEEYKDKKNSQRHFLDFMQVESDDPRRNQEGIYTSYVFGPIHEQVKIILLDARYFRNKKTLLGEKQWQWFEDQIRNSTAKFHLIANGTAVFYPNYKSGEEWIDVPGEIERLIELLTKHKPSGTLLISGDKHHSAFIKAKINGKIWHEFMSSGMTHSLIGKKPNSTDLALASGFPVNFDLYVGRNFGEIQFNWNDEPSLTLNIRSAISGKIKKTRTLYLKDM